MTEHMVAVFSSEAAASAAERELEQAGVPRTAIRRYAQGDDATETTTTRETTQRSGGGFWAWLLGEETESTRSFYADDDGRYDRSLQSGHAVLSVTLTNDSMIHETVEILERHDPLDLDERTEEDDPTESGATTGVARSGTDFSSSATAAAPAGGRPLFESGTSGATAAGTAPVTGGRMEDDVAMTGASAGRAGTGLPQAETGMAAGGTTPRTAGTEEVIPLAEEQLEVGTRTVDRGTRRVRRYVVETPVERDVTLRGERVTIERRTPTDARTADTTGAFEERVVEVHETEEVPEVRKTARVVEEVAIRREETERKERVQDTVRREEVEMAPDRTDKRQQG